MTAMLEAAIVLGLVFATVGVLTSRVDVLLIALPLLASAAIGVDRRPDNEAPSTMSVDVSRIFGDDGTSEFAYRIMLTVPARTELVQLRITPQGSRVHELLLVAHNIAPVTGTVPVIHSGRQRIIDVSYRLIGVDGSWLSVPVPNAVVERVVNPVTTPIASIPLPHRLTGLTGAHGSSRPGDGGEFRDLLPYAAGDRLRRIDWKATARRSQGFGDLYVRRTDATSDATVVIVMDSRDDVGERVERWAAEASGAVGVSSMDLAREAAASFAVAAIGTGDRVSLMDLAAHNGLVVAGGGKRHLDRLLRRIAVTAPSGTRLNRRRAPIVPTGSIVYLLSTFLDDDAAIIALLWRAAGHRVIAVDVLPTPLTERSAPYTLIAYRILMAERTRRMESARANGIEILRWQEDAAQPSRAVAIRTLTRVGRRRR